MIVRDSLMPFLSNPATFITFSLLAVGIASLSFLISGFGYRGKGGEAYSPLNHFISELGYVGVSRLAWVFNLGLILTGLCLLVACISLGVSLPGPMARINMVVGFIYAISVSLVGVFPMNKIKLHTIAAMSFFWSGLVFVFTFSLAIVLQPAGGVVLPRAYALAGLPALFAYGTFLWLISRVDRSAGEALSPDDINERPKVWDLVVAEWMTFVTVVIWILIVAVGL
jgi:hypothetical membrane protein